MSMLGNIFKSVVNPASLMQLAMGPAGWGSLAAKALFSAIGQQIIQKLGEKLGLPQPIIDGAQAAFCAATGDKNGVRQNIREATQGLAQQFNLSPVEQGQLERVSEQDVDAAVSSLSTGIAKAKQDGKGKSWLMAIAEGLGRAANTMATDLANSGKALGDKSTASAAAVKAGKAADGTLPSDNIKFATQSQEFQQFFTAANNVIKTIGEALVTGARKQ